MSNEASCPLFLGRDYFQSAWVVDDIQAAMRRWTETCGDRSVLPARACRVAGPDVSRQPATRRLFHRARPGGRRRSSSSSSTASQPSLYRDLIPRRADAGFITSRRSRKTTTARSPSTGLADFASRRPVASARCASLYRRDSRRSAASSSCSRRVQSLREHFAHIASCRSRLGRPGAGASGVLAPAARRSVARGERLESRGCVAHESWQE